jgi:hypothetical protein
MRGSTRLFSITVRFCVALGVASLTFAGTARAQSGGQSLGKQNLDLPFDALSLAEDDENAPEVIVFYGQSYEGDGIFYALDRSSSTANGELEREKQEVVRNLNEFSPHITFAVVFYDQGIRKYPPSGRPAQADAGGKSGAISWVLSQQTGGGSCAPKGITECLKYVAQSPARRNVIIWLGDGYTHCPGQSDWQRYGQQGLVEIKALNIKNAQINAIAVGPDSEVYAPWPKALAAQNRGTYSRIPR